MKAYVTKAEHFFLPQGWSRVMLGLFFLLGLIPGALCACHCSDFTFSLTRGLVVPSVSVAGLLMALFLPFVLSWAAFHVSPVLLFPVCFCKAFLFSFVHVCFALRFGSAGWLGRWLLLFSDCAALPLLYGFWAQLLSGTKSLRFLLLLPVFLAGLADFFWFQPLGAVFLS